MVIYEAHLKGLTIEFPGVPESDRGRFLGLANALVISHLKRLGVTTLMLLPVQVKEDDSLLLAKGLRNYWGYKTRDYFAPEPEYAREDPVAEFKLMVRALQAQGIEVILAVDYTYRPDSLRAGEPMAKQIIHDSLRYWANEMHINGFRFDLGPTSDGNSKADDEFLSIIASDEIISKRKLIAQPGNSGRVPQGYIELNNTFRDTSRQFWKGEKPAAELAELMVHRGRPMVNFVTCHDGFTLLDLVSYEQKRNVANGEDNRDGSNHNHSFNCGVEGETPDVQIRARRKKLRKNLLATLIFSQDIPMLLAGDEMGNTQFGNNNAYCQDNEISWLKWAQREEDMIEFVAQCVKLRRELLSATQPVVIESPANAARAFGIWFGQYCLFFNSAAENVPFSLPQGNLKEMMHTSRQTHSETISESYLLTAQSVALLVRSG